MYLKKISIPKNTTRENPQVDILPITYGIISKIFIHLPYGCAGLVGIRLEYATWPLLPYNRMEWIIGDDLNMIIEYNYEISNEPKEIRILSYNLDDTYQHNPIIAVNILKKSYSREFEKLLREF